MSLNIRRKIKILTMFFAGQGSAQALNLLSGFLVLRWLDVGSYAQYGLTFGFQSTLNMLIDMGFSSTIIALVGHRVDDRKVIGDYVLAGRNFRSRMLLIIMPISAVAYFYLTRHLEWSIKIRSLLLASIFISIYFSGLQAYYTPPLIVQRRLWQHYRIQIFLAIFRIVGYLSLYKMGTLTAVSAVWLNAIGIMIAGISYKFVSRPLIEEPVRPNPLVTRQMIHYVMPNLPGLIFFALQGQITVFLIATFGHSAAIAQVAALSRIGQVFILVSALNPTIIEPWFAKSPEGEVVKRYLLAVVITSVFSFLFVGYSIAFPRGLLWILGKQYEDLSSEIRWTVLTGCISYLASMTWTAISGRRLIYWRSTFLNIILILITQIIFVITVGVATPLQAVKFGCASVTASLLAQVINFGYGRKRGPRINLTVANPTS